MSSMSSSMSLSLSLSMSEGILSALSETLKSNIVLVVEECGKHYGFDVEEALTMLDIRNLELKVGKPLKSSKVSSKVSPKVEKSLSLKAAFPLPYNGEFNADTCFALKGELYTQCDSKRIEGGSFCKGCQKKADKNESGKPDSGTIKERQAVGIFEYVDSKGKKPISYAKVMSKLNLTRAEVEKEAGKLNLTINEDHFVSEQVKEKGAKGRPKRTKKVIEIEGSEEDLFASLVADAMCDEVEVVVEVEDADQEKAAKEQEKAAKKEAERIAKEQAKLEAEQKKEADRIAKEQAKEADRVAKEQAKLEAEQKKEADRIAKEQAKLEAEQKKEADRIAKEQAKEADRVAKEQAKLEAEQKKEADRIAKEQAKAAKEAEKAAKEEEKAAKKKKTEVVAEVAEDEPEVVKKIEENGKNYLKSKKSGLIYDYNEYKKNGEQVVVGKWNDKTNKIDFKTATDEESEDEYDDDN